MDWDTKIPSWDLPELERYSEPNIGSVVSGLSDACQGRQKSNIDCSVDLKLGGLGDFGSSSRWKENTKVSTSVVSPSGPSKRARTPSNGSQKVSCLVDGCKSDLSNCRDYHRRHKVCEAHSKTPMVLVGGQEQRFCQQCSRFHLLVEFDEVKRSCRKRLDGHNRRRRKPQPDPLSTGGFSPNLQGARFSSYLHMFPNLALDPTWGAVVKNEENGSYRFNTQSHYMDRQQIFTGPFTCSSRVEKRFPFLQENDAVVGDRTMQQQQQTSVCQPLINNISFSASSSNSGKMFSDRLSQVLDSDCALSLLSSPTQTTPAVNISHIVPADRIPVAQPLAQIRQPQQYNSFDRYSRSESSNNVSTTGFSCSGMGNDHHHLSTAVLVPDANGCSDLQSPVLFHVGGGDPSHGPSGLLPFSSWP